MRRGEISTATIVTIGTGMVMSLTGAIYASGVRTDDRIEEATKELRETNVDTLQRVAALEEAIGTIKSDTAIIKDDIKEVLRAVK